LKSEIYILKSEICREIITVKRNHAVLRAVRVEICNLKSL